MKIDEYAPVATPTNMANAKSFSVSPPKISSDRIGRSTTSEVFTERMNTWFKRVVDRVRVSQPGDHGGGLGVLLDLVVDDHGVVQREPEDREDGDHRRGRDLTSRQRIDAGRDEHVVDQRDDGADRHLPLEPQADVQHDRGEDDDQAGQRLLGDLLAPRGTDVLLVDVARVDARLLRQRLQQRVRLRPVRRERRRADQHRVAVRDLHLRVAVTVLVQHVGHLLGVDHLGERVLQLRAALEVDRQVQPHEDQAEQRERDHDPREREPPVAVLDDVEVGDGVPAVRVDRVADVHFDSSRHRNRRRRVAVMVLARDAALQTEAAQGHQLRAARDQEDRRTLEEVHDEQVEQRRDAEGQREPAHRADGGEVQDDRRDPRDHVGGDDRAVRALERRLHGRARRLPVADLVLQPLEEHDVGVGRHPERDHQTRRCLRA